MTQQDGSLAGRLEEGEVVHFSSCPFTLPTDQDRELLYQQRLHGLHKSIVWNPSTGRAAGISGQAPERVREVLRLFGDAAATWLATALPGYGRTWKRDLVSYHPEEEATRQLRLSARNDLLHLDAYPNRPSQGWRILRLYVNIHPTDPRIWVTSDTFAALLGRFAEEMGLPPQAKKDGDRPLRKKGLCTPRPSALSLVDGLLRMLPTRRERSAYDQFMLRFHHFLKMNEEFQERCRKRIWSFGPGSAWLVFTDAVSHAVLRGRYALDHSFFIAPQSLVLPEATPSHLLQQALSAGARRRAA
jgi:hypothetical protein